MLERGNNEDWREVFTALAVQIQVGSNGKVEISLAIPVAQLSIVSQGARPFGGGFHFSACTLLAVRTDPDVVPKYKGISLLLVDNSTPGITSHPTYTMGERTNEVFFDNVRVPKSCLLGKKNEGWVQLTTALACERAWTTGDVRRDFDELVDYCRKTGRDGKPLSNDPLVRQKLAQLAIELEVA